jgi:hypothetical protein
MTGDDYLNTIHGWPCQRRVLWRSTDHGRTWQQLCSFQWSSPRWYVGIFITGLWSDPTHLYGALDHNVGNKLIESTDMGLSWGEGTQVFNTPRKLLADPFRDGILWLVAQNNLYRSSTGINGFQHVLSLDTALLTTAVEGYQGVVYGAGVDRRIAYSRDGGESWTRIDLPAVPPVFAGTDILSLAVEMPPGLAPNTWTEVHSVHPTLRWPVVEGANRYEVSVFRYREVRGDPNSPKCVESDLDGAVYTSSENIFIDPENAYLLKHKVDKPEWFNPTWFPVKTEDRRSGATLEMGGYCWQVEAFDESGNSLDTSELAGFYIPSLGGSWEQVKANGLCKGTYDQNGEWLAAAPCIYQMNLIHTGTHMII